MIGTTQRHRPKRVMPTRPMSIQAEDIESVPLKMNRRRAAQEKRLTNLTEKEFVVWDGEGARAEGKRKLQHYVLFGAYDGAKHDYISARALDTFQCLEHIIKVGKDNPKSWHVGFYFDYDVNMILHNLGTKQFAYLKKYSHVRIGKDYRVEHIPGKWFRVTKYGPLYPAIKTDRVTVTIYDISGFYQTSFVKAITGNIPHHRLMHNLAELSKGKDQRKGFTYSQITYITKYWKLEAELFLALVTDLKEKVYAADLPIAKWHGPGELASYLYRSNGIRKHKGATSTDIYWLSRLAYAGGRFERFHIGRYLKVYGLDINSAYPNAIAKLPSFNNGEWSYNNHPTEIVEFGLYHIRLKRIAYGGTNPGPFFRRSKNGTISYPWAVEGWYWSPEIKAFLKYHPELIECVIEAWEFKDDGARPFAFIRDLYKKRRDLKAAGIGAQIAIKLALNSMYGKMAQRAGWQRTGKPPAWHQLEWAGWVTSYTRAMLYDLMCRIPYDQLIAVETDGLYTTATPESVSISHSVELGEWEVTYYDEIVYLQSGVYAKRQGKDWSTKYRGLDSDSLTAESIVDFSKTLTAVVPEPTELARDWGDCQLLACISSPEERRDRRRHWPKLSGNTTRFVGYQNALWRETQNRGPFKIHHCVWESEPREIDCQGGNKRYHSYRRCRACALGFNAYDMAHDTVIRPVSFLRDGDGKGIGLEMNSYPHDIPWIDDVDYAWRKFYDQENGMITDGRY